MTRPTTYVTDLHDMSMNESRFGPLPSVRAAVEQGAAQLHRYPSHTAAELVAALAGHYGVSPAEVLVGPGSAGLTQNLIASLGPERTEVVYPALSFEAYPLMVMNTYCRPVPVPMAGYGLDLDAMAAAITDNTRCVLVCNPNNPTGSVVGRDELTAFLDRVPADVPVFLDEAYREFVTDPDAADGMQLRAGRDNVCVLRTFSKAYGLATLRVGYAIVAAAIAQQARMTNMVYYPGGLAQLAAVAALEPEAEKQMQERCAEFAGVRARFVEDLRAAGLDVPDSQGNFVWLPLGAEAEDFVARCRAAGILLRAHPGLGVRVTVGTDEANQRLLGVVAAG
ncbi:aminotransferase class I/II-fold pyridoxal phosphate-dependent enzyme [Jatrophihabitans sp.]|uniref:aminotransferase class I/II-fold pyridoxal phosphate-dependent enzyme n=1 Tax=Jatrophihabitans sp. TaxID=1932789 RepID=UPI002BD3F171|nr:aminotransferase class I/II-fold pyridoxal phosphate-dependent enzyme [Jatrophihabitans sp.]